MRVETGKIVEFAAAVKASNPIHYDAEAARGAGYDDIVAPPTFSAVSQHWAPKTGNVLGLDLKRTLAGGTEWEYHEPITAGEELTIEGTVVSVEHKEGRRGGMTKIVIRETFTNAAGKTAMVINRTIMELDSPTEKGGAHS